MLDRAKDSGAIESAKRFKGSSSSELVKIFRLLLLFLDTLLIDLMSSFRFYKSLLYRLFNSLLFLPTRVFFVFDSWVT